MSGHLYRRSFVALIVIVGTACAARGEAPNRLVSSQPDVRSGGVLEESYNYHRPQASGWYGYGFPVSTFRWGWFGAEHYYPRVFWHEGYYGDCCRYSYRHGY
jgi:hypothetical protein